MKTEGRRRSRNVEDRRGARPAGAIAGGGLAGVVLLVVLGLLSGADPMQIIGAVLQQQMAPQGQTGPYRPTPEEEARKAFVEVVLADTEDAWNRMMPGRYEEPTLVFFSGYVDSACGLASQAVGPFYCPADKKAYIDLSFFTQLEQRFGAPGDFAQAYVIAHEVGHHVQNLLGVSEQVFKARQQVSEAEGNALSVRTELQADCYAGAWAHYADNVIGVLEQGDLDEALRAAAAIGDDTLQRKTQGQVAPDSFTHGTSEQRMRWFRRGYLSGDPAACDTFSTDDL